MTDNPPKPKTFIRRRRKSNLSKPFMEDGVSSAAVQDLAVRDAQEDRPPKLVKRHRKGRAPYLTVTEVEKVKKAIGPKQRALEIAEGFRKVGCSWEEHVECVMDMARAPTNDPELRMRAWRELERLAEKAAVALLAEATSGKYKAKQMRDFVEYAVTKRILEGDMDAAKMAIQAGQVEGWAPEAPSPTTATQINVYGDISPDKKARLDELDLLISKPLPVLDIKPGEVPVEIIVPVPEESPNPDEPPDVEPAESED